MGDITITSTSDTAEQVSQALGLDKTPEAETPPAEPPAAEATADAPPDSPDGDADDADDTPDGETPPPPPAEGDAEVEDEDDGTVDPEVSQAARTLAHQSKAQRRIQNLRAKLSKRDRAIETLQKELNWLKAPPATPPAAPPVAATPPAVEVPAVVPAPPAAAAPPLTETFDKPMPKDDDFEDFEALQTARVQWMQEWTDWRLAKADRERAQREAENVTRARAAEAQRRADLERQTRVEAVKQRIPDFEAVMAATTVQLPKEVLARIGTEAVGMEMAYYIATHPEEAAKFQIGGDTVDQVVASRDAAFVELGILRARVEAGLPGAKPVPPLRLVPGVSKAPEPMTRATGASTPVSKAPDKMTQDEYRAWRRSGGGR